MSLARIFAPLLAVVVFASARARAEEPEPVDVLVQGERPLRHDQGRDETAATYVVRHDDLRAPGATVSDALLPVPGVQVARSGAPTDLATAAVRGATSAQTPVYLAGIRLNDDLTGTADLSTVPIFMLDRIEVYRGNAPFDADRLGLGGAIFLEPSLPHASHVGGGLGAGSFGEIGAWAKGSVRSGDAAISVSVRRDAAKNDYPYLDDGRTRFDPTDDVIKSRVNADAESYDAWTIARYAPPSRTRLLALANVFTREQGVTGLSVFPAYSSRLRSRRAMSALSATVPCSEQDGSSCSVELVTSGLFTDARLTDPLGELALGSAELDSRAQRISQQERLHYDLGWGAFTLASSQEGERLEIDAKEGPFLRARRAIVRGAATFLVRATPDLTAQALGAIDCNATIGPQRQNACDAQPTGRVGLAYAIADGWKLATNAGRYVREPTLGELYGISASLRPNPALAPETGWTADAGVAWSHKAAGHAHFRLYAELFAFARFASQLIAYRRSSFSGVTPYNVGAARVLGTEALLGSEALRALRVELSATALDPRDTSPGRTIDNDLLPLRSRLILSPYVELFTERLPGFDRASLAARVSHRSAEVADEAGLEVIGAETAVDIELALIFLQQKMGARLRMADVFDAPLSDVVGYPLPGRSLHASLEAEW